MNNKAKLSSGDRHKYTDKDLALFSLLSERDKIDSKELAVRYFKKRSMYDRQNITSSMKNLRDKMLANGEKFTLEKTKRQGPRPAEFWLERRRA